MIKKCFILGVFFLFTGQTSLESETDKHRPAKNRLAANERTEFGAYFREYNVTGSFLLYDFASDKYISYNSQRNKQGFLPASTFKILNTMIGLQTGAIPSVNYTQKWDGVKRTVEVWNRDHNLKSAFKNSVVWYYQEVARKIGKKRMQDWVNKINYGNRNIGGGIDEFWLTGDLRITVEEQVEFLFNMYFFKMPFSMWVIKEMKKIMLVEKTSSYRLSTKTGRAKQDGKEIGWYVGFIEKNNNVYCFATNIESANPGSNFSVAREKISRKIFKKLGLL